MPGKQEVAELVANGEPLSRSWAAGAVEDGAFGLCGVGEERTLEAFAGEGLNLRDACEPCQLLYRHRYRQLGF